MKKIVTPHYRRDRDRWEWRGIFRQHPKKNGRPTELTLGSFEDFPAEKNAQGKYQPVDPDRLFQRWAEKDRELDNDRKSRPWKYSSDQVTVAEMIREYENTYYFRSELGATKRRYRLAQHRWWIRECGNIKLSDFHAGRVREKRELLLRKRKEATVNDYLNALSSAFEQMRKIWFEEKRNWIPDNPVIYRYPVAESVDRILSLDEFDRFLAACETVEQTLTIKGFYLCVNLALDTGGRLREVCKLKWDQVDLERGWITYIKTKNKKHRTLELTPVVLKLIRDWSKVRRIDNDYVFPGKQRNHTEYKKPFQKALRIAAIENFSFHNLRHTFASYMAISGLQENKISQAMGHEQKRSTERYLHLRPEQSETAGIMADLRQKTTQNRR